MSKFEGKRTNSLEFSSLKCSLQEKNLIRENSAKNVNQKGSLYFRPKRKNRHLSQNIYLVFVNNFFYIKDHYFNPK